MAKTKTAAEQPEDRKPLEFWIDDTQWEDEVLLILARDLGDGKWRGKVRMVPKGSLTLEQFGRVYEEMLYDYKADHNEQF